MTSLETRVTVIEARLAQLLPIQPVPQPTGKVLWRAGMEVGNLTEWGDGNNGGGEFDSGGASSAASQDFAHSGLWSAKLTMPNTSVEQGTRLFRWLEPRATTDLFYSAWYYFPVRYSYSSGWSNIMQWKSRSPTNIGGANTSDPMFFLTVANRPSGNMYLRPVWWNQLRIEGPLPGQSGQQRYEQTAMDIPVGRWTKIEVHHIAAGGFTGRFTVWQDDIQLLDLTGVRTIYPDSLGFPAGDTAWSVNNYGQGITPSPCTIYIDDAAISTDRVANSS